MRGALQLCGRQGTAGRNLKIIGFSLLLVAAVLTLRPAQAIERDADMEQIRATECFAELYRGFDSSADPYACDSHVFLRSSAAFKCSLFVDRGFPSELMQRACDLYDRGIIKTFTQGANFLD